MCNTTVPKMPASKGRHIFEYEVKIKRKQKYRWLGCEEGLNMVWIVQAKII